MRDLTLGLAMMAVILAAPAAGAGAEETIDATDPAQILALVQGYGEAALTTDNLGDPLIEGRIGEKDYELFFYGCTEGRGCKSLMFRAIWEAEELTDEMMANWNREKRFGKAYLDQDANANVEMSVNLHGGVSQANLDDTIDWWRLVLSQFADYFDFE
ncbi:MAG: YbjN domain-containing protein [Proteobacteria bacterium]|nr:YbjN domain-containing protein [Pseudomonadota bacterium]